MPDPDLFDVRRRRKPAPKPAAPNGAVQHLLAAYIDGYRAKFDEPPVITKKDGAILKRLVLAYGEETVAVRLREYFRWEDPFVVRSAWSIGILGLKWNELAGRLKPAKVDTTVQDAERTSEYLRRLRLGKKR